MFNMMPFGIHLRGDQPHQQGPGFPRIAEIGNGSWVLFECIFGRIVERGFDTVDPHKPVIDNEICASNGYCRQNQIE